MTRQTRVLLRSDVRSAAVQCYKLWEGSVGSATFARCAKRLRCPLSDSRGRLKRMQVDYGLALSNSRRASSGLRRFCVHGWASSFPCSPTTRAQKKVEEQHVGCSSTVNCPGHLNCSDLGRPRL